MRIAIAQIDTTVGAFASNADRIRTFGREALARGASLLLAPEQAIPGYPARDFLGDGEFVEANVRALDDLARDPALSKLGAFVGFAEPHTGYGAGLHNAGALLLGGERVATARKTLIPNYDVFDESRYFDPGNGPLVFEHQGVPIAFTICEDVWSEGPPRRYERDPVGDAVALGARLVVNISASPYFHGKPQLREKMLGEVARRHGVPIVYCNLAGATDGLIFDGNSLVVAADGTILHRAKGFAEDLLVVDVEPAERPILTTSRRPIEGGDPDEAPRDADELLEALVFGIQGYARRTGFQRALVGLSGGMDSALVAVLATRAFGPENVMAVAMPSRYTASMSNEDAAALARNLGIRFETLPIEEVIGGFERTLSGLFAGTQPGLAEENLQARARGNLLMSLSNKFGSLLLTTGNKSEVAVGYCTLYGDMCGGLAPLADVYKTTVYDLARHINREKEVIPWRIITRPPSAELRENQTDQDSLPPYEILDRILRAHLEKGVGAAGLVAAGEDEAVVRRVLHLVRLSEYKRRQAAPPLKVSPRAFGEGWRYPIANRYRPI